MRLKRLRASTFELGTVYAWHYGSSVPSTGPVLGIDLLAGGSPFGIDPLQLVADKFLTNPNMVVAGAPGNGKSAFVKSLIWWLCGAWGKYRFVATDVKGEYRDIAAALGVPVLDLHPGGTTRINPLDDPAGRVEFVAALMSMACDRSLRPIEFAVLNEMIELLPPGAQLSTLLELLRNPPPIVCESLRVTEENLLVDTQELRFGLNGLLRGSWAGMFDGETNVTIDPLGRGFVIDVARCGTDERVLRLALLAGQRAASQLLAGSTMPTLRVNDEGWRVTSTAEGARWMQADFKLGRVDALANVLVVHRFAEIGAQAEGVAGKIASRLVSDADIRVMFRQGEEADAADCVTRFQLPSNAGQLLLNLGLGRCLVYMRGNMAVLQTILSPGLQAMADTNQAVRGIQENVA